MNLMYLGNYAYRERNMRSAAYSTYHRLSFSHLHDAIAVKRCFFFQLPFRVDFKRQKNNDLLTFLIKKNPTFHIH